MLNRFIHRFTLQINTTLILLLSSLVVGCGGGGGGSSSGGTGSTATSTPYTPAPYVPTNEVEKAISGGLFLLSGYSYTVNGVPQTIISKTQPVSSGQWGSTILYGAASSGQTIPRIDDPIISIAMGSTTTVYSWEFPANGTSANLYKYQETTPTWTFSLNSVDVSGQTVLSQMKDVSGALLSPALANPGAVFPAGSIAYTATYSAAVPLILPDSNFTLRGGAYGVMPVQVEADMYGTGWCMSSSQANTIGVLVNAANTVSIFDVPTGCSFTGLTPIATGSWSKQTQANGDVIYRIAYPASLTNDPAWASYFQNGYSPTSGLANLIIDPAGATTPFTTGYEVAAGSTYTSLRPFFNSVALPALRSAAGI